MPYVKSLNNRSMHVTEDEVRVLTERGLIRYGWGLPEPSTYVVYRPCTTFKEIYKVVGRYEDKANNNSLTEATKEKKIANRT